MGSEWYGCARKEREWMSGEVERGIRHCDVGLGLAVLVIVCVLLVVFVWAVWGSACGVVLVRAF